MNSLYSFRSKILLNLLHCHHFTHHCIGLMNTVSSEFDNFVSLSGNNKKDVLLCSDSRFDENKNKFILEATIIINDSVLRNVHLYRNHLYRNQFSFLFFSYCLVFPDNTECCCWGSVVCVFVLFYFLCT